MTRRSLRLSELSLPRPAVGGWLFRRRLALQRAYLFRFGFELRRGWLAFTSR
jgi:hypothetical protein